MWGKRSIVLVAQFVLLAACAGGGSGSNTPSNTQTSTTTATPSPTDSDSPECVFDDDFADPGGGLIEILPPDGGSFAELTERRQVACLTRLRVDRSGVVDLAFGQLALCQFSQDPGTGKIASAVTREQENTVFRILGGRALCTFKAGGQEDLCGLGTLLVSDAVQISTTCDADPVFVVSTFAGSVEAIDPNGQTWLIPPGMGLEHSFDTGESRLVSVNFNPPDEVVFAQQAAALGLIPLPQGEPFIDDREPTFVAIGGDWAGSPPPDLTYQWQGACRSEDGPDGCTDIVGATMSSYTPTTSDCPAVRVVVTGSNTSGSTSSPSEPMRIDAFVDCQSPSQSVSGSPVIG